MQFRLAAVILIASYFAVGCDRLGAPAHDRYQLFATPDGRARRIDKEQGDVFLIENDVMTRIPEDSKLSLSVGRIYKFEDGRWMKYLGNGKFEPAQKVIDWKDLSKK